MVSLHFFSIRQNLFKKLNFFVFKVQEPTSPVRNQQSKSSSLAFEVILDTAKGTTPAKLTPHNTPNRQLTNEDIKNKLQKAEERRQSLELAKLSMINEKFQK